MNEVREAIAAIIYDIMPYDGPYQKPEWIPHGNAIKQDEARQHADKIMGLIGPVSRVVVRTAHRIYGSFSDANQAVAWLQHARIHIPFSVGPVGVELLEDPSRLTPIPTGE